MELQSRAVCGAWGEVFLRMKDNKKLIKIDWEKVWKAGLELESGKRIYLPIGSKYQIRKEIERQLNSLTTKLE